jgi:hypothetical protein
LGGGTALLVTLLYAALSAGVRVGFAALSRLTNPPLKPAPHVAAAWRMRPVPVVAKIVQNLVIISTTNGNAHDFTREPRGAIILSRIARKASHPGNSALIPA